MVEVVAETERLRLRTWGDGDQAEFARVTNTPAVMRWLGGVADEQTLAAAFNRIDSYHRDYGHTLWIVERRSDDALLGFCGLKRTNSPGGEAFHGEFEIGWRLREDAWGQGFAKEAATKSLDLAFARFGAPQVVALTVSGNAASWGLMERLGMQAGRASTISTRGSGWSSTRRSFTRSMPRNGRAGASRPAFAARLRPVPPGVH